jgi:hypothetical protein
MEAAELTVAQMLSCPAKRQRQSASRFTAGFETVNLWVMVRPIVRRARLAATNQCFGLSMRRAKADSWISLSFAEAEMIWRSEQLCVGVGLCGFRCGPSGPGVLAH